MHAQDFTHRMEYLGISRAGTVGSLLFVLFCVFVKERLLY